MNEAKPEPKPAIPEKGEADRDGTAMRLQSNA